MTIVETAVILAFATGVAAGHQQKQRKLVHPIAGMTPQQREEFWAEERRKLRERILSRNPSYDEDPIDAVLRKIYRGDYQP